MFYVSSINYASTFLLLIKYILNQDIFYFFQFDISQQRFFRQTEKICEYLEMGMLFPFNIAHIVLKTNVKLVVLVQEQRKVFLNITVHGKNY